MPRDATSQIPGVAEDDIAAVANLIPGLPNLQAGVPDRFAQAVLSLVEKRACQGWPNEGDDDVAVFVMVGYPREVGQRHGAAPFTDPLATATPLLGRIFFTNCDASAGRSMSLPTDQTGILEWLDDASLTSSPVVIVYRNAMTMVTRLAGTQDAARNDPIRDYEPAASLSELLKALRHFHIQRLLTPSCCPDGVWKPRYGHQYIPAERPEKSIQMSLQTALSSWFHGNLRAEVEDTTNIGRIDVRLLSAVGSGPLQYWAIIELKVIKSFTTSHSPSNPSTVSQSTNERAITEGIKQASAYRANRRSAEALIEVYDLRIEKRRDLFRSSRIKNALRQYRGISSMEVRPLFGSATEARASGYTGV